MDKYWEKEKPIVVRSAKNVLTWYPQAGRLQVSLADWRDEQGVTHRGKTVTLDVDAMRESDDVNTAIRVTEDVLNQLRSAQ